MQETVNTTVQATDGKLKHYSGVTIVCSLRAHICNTQVLYTLRNI